jgi:putative ABC transport system permease protein
LNSLVQDLKYGMRMLRKFPVLTAAAVVCIALGAGATTAIFSVVNAVVLRPLPYKDPERLVRIYTEFPTFPGGGLRRFWISPAEYLDLRRELKSWDGIDGWVVASANLAGSVQPLRVTEAYVTGGLFQMLGSRAELGRVITPQDDLPSSPLTAVISHGLWQRAFGADRNVVGRDVLLDGLKCTIAGVMPPDFRFPPEELNPTDIWVPGRIDPANPGGRGNHYLSLMGRLKPDVSMRRAQEELAQKVNYWGSTATPKHHAFHPRFHPIVSYPFHDEVVGQVRPALLALLGAVAFVLLIACVNVANLLLARAEGRQREVAVRTALGADFRSLVRQFVAEGLLLSAAGAALGLALAYAGLQAIKAASGASMPRASEIGIDWRVLAFTAGVSVLTGLFFGLAPLLQVAARNVHDSLKAGVRTTATAGAQQFRRALVVAELALALVLLIGTGLMIRAFWNLQRVNAGFEPQGLLTMRVILPDGVYKDARSVLNFWSAVQERVRAIPGAVSASMMSGLPPLRQLNANDTGIEGFVERPGGPKQNVDYWQAAGDRYFETMGIRLIDGRFFDERDGESAPPAVIVNQAMAHMFWPGESPIGRRVRTNMEGPWQTVVGVVADVKNGGLDRPAGTELFIPYRQAAGLFDILREASIVVRTTGNPGALASGARRAVREVDPAMPVSDVRTMDDVISAVQARPRFLTTLLTLFAAVALLLAAVGIYGVISFSVARRTGEIGVRMALGASAGDVLGMVLGQGMKLAAAGVALGAIGAFALTRFISGLLYGVSSLDARTFAAMALLLSAVTLLACYLPARQATKVDPTTALRYE